MKQHKFFEESMHAHGLSVQDTVLSAASITVFKASLEKTSYPFVVKHVEKQPQEVAKQDQSVRERNPLKVRSEIRLTMNISFFAIQATTHTL